jgi:hypothetical protein
MTSPASFSTKYEAIALPAEGENIPNLTDLSFFEVFGVANGDRSLGDGTDLSPLLVSGLLKVGFCDGGVKGRFGLS